MARRQVSTLCALKLDLLNTWTLDGLDGGVVFLRFVSAGFKQWMGLWEIIHDSKWWMGIYRQNLDWNIIVANNIWAHMMFGYVSYFNHPPTGDCSVVEFLKRLVFDHRHQQGLIHHHCLLGLVTWSFNEDEWGEISIFDGNFIGGPWLWRMIALTRSSSEQI